MKNKNTEQNVRFVYTINRSGRKVTTAYMYDDSINAIRLAKAECSKRDQFVKKIGRDVSFGRLISKGGSVVNYDTIGGSTYGHIARYIAENVDSL